MTERNLELNLLADVLFKKKEALQYILNITENQEMVLKQPKSQEITDLFNEMSAEKQRQIDTVLQSDVVFQDIFARLKNTFDDVAENNKEQVRILQDLIKEVTDIDVAIRVKEERNKTLFNQNHTTSKPDTTNTNKRYLLEQYAKHKKD